VGFQRVTVQPNETKTVEVSVPASRLAYWDAKRQAFQVEAERVSLMVGDSSVNLPLNATVNAR
jgi:beta-glucosidase